MNTYRVAWDWTKAQPRSLPAVLGPRNEGFLLDANDLEHAKHLIRQEYHLNPFYVSIVPVPQVGKE